NSATEAYTRCLEIWRKRREEKTGRTIKTAAEIAKELPLHVREFIVDRGRLPASGGERRVRVPGALTFSTTNDLGDGGGAAGPAIAAGPRQFLTNAVNHSFAAADPQRYNAHQSRGGKRGMPVLNNVFGALPAAGFPGMTAPAASLAPRTDAVFVQTNPQGKA